MQSRKMQPTTSCIEILLTVSGINSLSIPCNLNSFSTCESVKLRDRYIHLVDFFYLLEFILYVRFIEKSLRISDYRNQYQCANKPKGQQKFKKNLNLAKVEVDIKVTKFYNRLSGTN